MIYPKTFKYDRAVRDLRRVPLGRVVVSGVDDVKVGEPFYVTLLVVPLGAVPDVLSGTYYVDGCPYKIPKDISPIRVSSTLGRYQVNSFIFEPADSNG